jgi:hypothetical protein
MTDTDRQRGTPGQWERALWESFGVREWTRDDVARDAVKQYLAAAHRDPTLTDPSNVWPIVQEVIDAVLEAGSAGKLDGEMLPHGLRPTYVPRGGADERRPPLEVIAGHFVDNKATKGLREGTAKSLINELLTRLRSRLAGRDLPLISTDRDEKAAPA